MPHALLKNHEADLAIVLGSGLDAISNAIEVDLQLPYQGIPNFADGSIEGHSGLLTLGRLNGLKVACFQGRPHWYQGVEGAAFLTMMSIPKALGCTEVIITNAAGALNKDYNVGDLVLVNDHINLQGKSPLLGLNPPAFVGLDCAYDPDLRKQFLALGQSLDIHLHEGVYTGVLGPNFETPAEIRMMQALGGDVIGMSSIPEVIAARYYDLKVCAISVISNMAAGISDVALSHDVTLQGAEKACANLTQLIHTFCQNRASE